MKKLLIIFIALLTLQQCTKAPKNNDLSGTASLKGIAVIYDTLNGVVNTTLAKDTKIYLRYKSDTSGFLYSTSTNASAQYTFNGIELNNNYVIYTNTDAGAVKYYGELSYLANGFKDRQSDTLKLYPASTNQNGWHLIVQDSLGGRVANVTAWIFNSQVLFASDSSVGKILDMTTNSFGISNQYNLAAGTYYFRVKTKIGNMDLVGEAIGTLGEKGIKDITIVLKKSAFFRNGIELYTLDIFGNPLNNASSYFYRSKALYLADSSSTSYSNSLFSLNSNASGFASTYLIDSALYYFRSVRVAGIDTLKVADSVIVQYNGIIRKTVELKK